jgi:hypothetical protein
MSASSKARAALAAGKKAAEDGKPATNPHDGNSTDPAERVQSRLWRQGYQAGNPMPSEAAE